jgi:hypothetical protein
MGARVCRECEYNITSTVVTACPNCGAALPTPIASSSPMGCVTLGLVLLAGAAGFVVLRHPEAVRSLVPPAGPPASPAASAPVTMPPSTLARPTPPPPRAAVTAIAPAPDDAEVAKMVAGLQDSETAWASASALAQRTNPRAGLALMAAYDKREYAKMAGATAFYARRKPPGYDKVLIDLLHASKDLAVAQELILSNDARLAEPARKWAAELGFKLVRSKDAPNGVTWVSASDPR